MFAQIRLLICCAFVAVLSGCVESEHPLIEPMQADQDARLYGVWKRTNDDGSVEFVHIGREAYESLDPDRGEPEPGLMRYWSVVQSPQTHAVENPSGHLFFCTKVGGQSFANWVSPPNPSSHKPRTYFLLKYDVDQNELVVWLQDPESTARAIEMGKLKGAVKRKLKKSPQDAPEFEELRITDTGEGMTRFLAGGGTQVCFPDGGRKVYHRVR